ncbi:hypothetical protein Q4595_15045 [Wenyingzhuangia sp. 1_MG-2023]|nr:hypothetical protein [Wenyingzhuangia sp. 1_MG-2023]
MKPFNYLLLIVLAINLISCVQEDIVNDTVPEELRITTSINQLQVGDVIKLEAVYFNNVGQTETKNVVWETSNENVISISDMNIEAETEGLATVTAKVNGETMLLMDSKTLQVVKVGMLPIPSESEAIKVGTLKSTSSYVCEGDFEIAETTTGIAITVASNYRADTTLPGFVMYLTNNPNSIANGLVVDAFDDADGAHYNGAFTFDVAGVGINDYSYLVHWCRPFGIKAGDATINDK